jgi:UDP-N-acetylmuramate--alanine ligase
VVPDLSVKQSIHIIAVGGAAMSAIAFIASRMGHSVTGSDQSESAAFERLRASGLEVWTPHDRSRVGTPDVVMVSAAVPSTNQELAAAKDQNLPIASRADVMEALGSLRRTIAVSGTAGKTTTSAMMATVASSVGWNPSMIVGAPIHGLGDGVEWNDTEWFVVEADESDGSFLRFHAEAIVITNIEPDHLDYWGSMDRLEDAFDRFTAQATGPKVINADDPGCQELLRRLGSQGESVVTFGTSEHASYRIANYGAKGLESHFDVLRGAETLARVQLNVPGLHNAMNAAAVFAMAVELGIAPTDAANGLATFRGAARRYEYRGTANGVTFVDDYAHLPGKARAAVDAALLGGWPRVVAVYQPHRFTRTRDLWSDHRDSFVGVDVLIITGIYAAGQEPIAGVSGKLIADAVKDAHPTQRVIYCETRSDVIEALRVELRSGDLCLTMNAGDLTTLPDEMLLSSWNTGIAGPEANEATASAPK